MGSLPILKNEKVSLSVIALERAFDLYLISEI